MPKEEFARLVNRYLLETRNVDSRGFVTFIFSSVAGILFILGFVLPFYSFVGDTTIFLTGDVSLVLIVVAFTLNLKNGSSLVGSVMTPMGVYGIFYGVNSWIGFLKVVVHADDPDFIYNTSGLDEYIILVLAISSVFIAMGLFTILRRLTKIKKIEKKSA